ncbi:RDD family protein [Streptomyces zingiberis]|uniref:RDD family protein n=1 Tax=Streptomyces zingiberis TaxID=2053010 RepID=A0ABX1BXH8_9ACTN|nr:RDD family protein [Streptomyces zingiberis]NJQ01808.1 RDD family protein [Streptomyces zingiberis]
MSSDRPESPSGEPPERDPFRPPPPEGGDQARDHPSAGGGPGSAVPGGGPYGPGGGPSGGHPPGGPPPGEPAPGEPGGPPGPPPPGGYGAPPAGGYGAPPAGGYGAPPGGPYGAPYGEPYGAALGRAPFPGNPPLANRGRRLLARIIDALLIGVPVGLLAGGLATGFRYDYDVDSSGAASGGAGNAAWAASQLAIVAVYFVYEGAMLSRYGQTVGKMLLRVRVAMLAGGAVPAGGPGWARAAVYSLPQVVPCFGFFFWLLNVGFCTWDQPWRQCLHDKAAKTVVVAVDRPVR